MQRGEEQLVQRDEEPQQQVQICEEARKYALDGLIREAYYYPETSMF